MRTASTLIAAALLMFGLSATALAQETDNSCFALEGTSDYYFGEIDQNATVEHTFVFKNNCDRTIEIGSARASCGCTAAVISETSIAPGKEAKIQVKFTPPKGTRGRTTKTVSLYLKDEQQPHTVIRFSATVQTDIDVQPQYIQLMGGEVGKEISGSATVKNVSQKELNISDINVSMTTYADTSGTGNVVGLPLTSARISPERFTLKAGESRDVTVFVTPQHKGQISGAVRLKAGDNEGMIQVFGVIREATPNLQRSDSGQLLNSAPGR
jgi:hypothetical protein